jgi:hypothetical protein
MKCLLRIKKRRHRSGNHIRPRDPRQKISQPVVSSHVDGPYAWGWGSMCICVCVCVCIVCQYIHLKYRVNSHYVGVSTSSSSVIHSRVFVSIADVFRFVIISWRPRL